ncbi:hypothetical protein G6F23_014182 [Rhizopus arrhizus]|nr:hypothetical protein G6F23_014182 [Rhizopus arrhizus]
MASTSPARRPRVASITLGPPVGSLSALSSTGSCPRCSSINSGSACAIRLDLPEPEMPVTAVSNPSGTCASTPCRLCRWMPCSSSQLPAPRLRLAGAGTWSKRYRAVRESWTWRRPSGSPL